LTCGGAERVVATLATKFQAAGHQVTVVTISSDEKDFYVLPVSVKRIALDKMQDSDGFIGAVASNYSRIAAIRRAVKIVSADVVVSHLTETNVLAVMAGFGTKVPVVITEHCDPANISYGRLWTMLRRIVYPQSDMLVSVSQGVDDFFKWLSNNRKRVIYNPFFVPAPNDTDCLELLDFLGVDEKVIVSMGRLTHQKGFDLLLRAFAKAVKNYPDWKLIILGDGELRNELEQLIQELGIDSSVTLPGRVSNPFSLLRKADLFVMSSRFEGFPMAHGEAMLCGLPVVATDCPSGPRELIRDEVDGILVPNGDLIELQKAMKRLMSDAQLREKMSNEALHVSVRFDVEEIVDEWFTVFADVGS